MCHVIPAAPLECLSETGALNDSEAYWVLRWVSPSRPSLFLALPSSHCSEARLTQKDSRESTKGAGQQANPLVIIHLLLALSGGAVLEPH